MSPARPFFDAYVNIVSTHADLNNLAKANHGFRVSVRDRGWM